MLEEPVLDRGERDFALLGFIVIGENGGGGPIANRVAERRHGLRGRFHDLVQRDRNARLRGAGDDLNGQNRIAAQIEEVVVNADLLQTQYVAPDAAERALGVVAGSDAGLTRLHRRGLEREQLLAIDLAAGGERQRGQCRETRGQHVVGQALGEELAQLFERGRLVRPDPCFEMRSAAVVIDRQHRAFAHARMLRQHRFELAELHAMAAHFDLMIDAAAELDRAVRPHACEVAAAIQAFPPLRMDWPRNAWP